MLPPAEPEQVPSKADRNGEERGGDASASVAAYASMRSAGRGLLGCWALGLRILVPQTRNDADMPPCVPRHYIVLDHVSKTAYASCPRVRIATPLYCWLHPPCYEQSGSPVSAYRPEPLGPSCRQVKSLKSSVYRVSRALGVLALHTHSCIHCSARAGTVTRGSVSTGSSNR